MNSYECWFNGSGRMDIIIYISEVVLFGNEYYLFRHNHWAGHKTDVMSVVNDVKNVSGIEFADFLNQDDVFRYKKLLEEKHGFSIELNWLKQKGKKEL